MMMKDRFTDSDEVAESKKETFSQKFGFITRSLVKNNIVMQNFYIALLAFEYLTMMFYVLRLTDPKSFRKFLSPIENFLDVSITEN